MRKCSVLETRNKEVFWDKSPLAKDLNERRNGHTDVSGSAFHEGGIACAKALHIGRSKMKEVGGRGMMSQQERLERMRLKRHQQP